MEEKPGDIISESEKRILQAILDSEKRINKYTSDKGNAVARYVDKKIKELMDNIGGGEYYGSEEEALRQYKNPATSR